MARIAIFRSVRDANPIFFGYVDLEIRDEPDWDELVIREQVLIEGQMHDVVSRVVTWVATDAWSSSKHHCVVLKHGTTLPRDIERANCLRW